MDNNFSARLKTLRNNKSFTQQALADTLGVTSKAVSKWENGGGMPEITIFPGLAKSLDTTIEYLMTGEDNSKPLSDVEVCAKKNTAQAYFELKERKALYRKDDTGKDLLQYVFEYDSYNVLSAMYHDQNLLRFLNTRNNRGVRGLHNAPKRNQLIKLAIMANDTELLDALKLKEIKIESDTNNYGTLRIRTLKEAVSNRDFKNETLSYMLQKNERGRIWVDGYTGLATVFLTSNHEKNLQLVLSEALKNNEEVRERYDAVKKKNNNSMHSPFETVNKNECREARTHKFLGQFIKIPESIITQALNQRIFDMASLMNDVNRQVPYTARPYVADEYEFESRRILDDENLSDLDKKKKLITFGGIVKIDDLIALNNYKAYKELIKLPASRIERAFEYLHNGDYKKLFKYAQENGLDNVINKIHLYDKEVLTKELERSHKPSPYPASGTPVQIGQSRKSLVSKDNPNFKHYAYYMRNNQDESKKSLYDRLVEGKRLVRFIKIINHKDIEFFELAARTDSKNLDWALENVNPKRFNVIKLLLDKGAKLHKRWKEDDGWGYIVDRDETDQIETEILRKKIDDIVGEKDE